MRDELHLSAASRQADAVLEDARETVSRPDHLAAVGPGRQDDGMTESTTTYAGLTPDDYLRHLRADTDRILDLARDDLDADVPLCPGWTVRDAVEHTGSVFSHKVAACTGGRPTDGRVVARAGRRAGPDGLVPRAAGRAARHPAGRVTPRRRHGPGTRTTRTSASGSAGWRRRRRCTGSTSRAATTRSARSTDDLAVDGIDEVLDWFLAYQAEDVGTDGSWSRHRRGAHRRPHLAAAP